MTRLFGKLNKYEKFLPLLDADKKADDLTERKLALIDQHPKGLGDSNPNILSTEKIFYLTKPNEVDIRFYNLPDVKRDTKSEKPEKQKLIRVAFVGLPNAGKSTLVNKLCGTQVSAVSKLSYTTWDNTIGVKSDIESGVQTIFVDTPGIVDRYAENKEQVTEAWKAVDDADMVAFVIDGARKVEDAVFQVLKKIKEKNQSEEFAEVKKLDYIVAGMKDHADNLTYAKRQLILIINKLDLVGSRRKVISLKDELEDIIHFEKIFLTSGETGFGIEKLTEYIDSCAQEMKWEYEPDVKIDKSEVELVEEYMREIIFKRFYFDVPFKIDIKTTQMAVRSDGLLNVIIQLKAFERNKVPILMGTQGRNLKWMKNQMEAKLAARFGIRTNVNLIISESRFKMHEALKFRGDLLDDKKAALDDETRQYEVKKRDIKLNLDPRDSRKRLESRIKSIEKMKSLVRTQKGGENIEENIDSLGQEKYQANSLIKLKTKEEEVDGNENDSRIKKPNKINSLKKSRKNSSSSTIQDRNSNDRDS